MLTSHELMARVLIFDIAQKLKKPTAKGGLMLSRFKRWTGSKCSSSVLPEAVIASDERARYDDIIELAKSYE